MIPSKKYFADKIQSAARAAVSLLPDNPSMVSEIDYESRNFFKGHDSFINADYALKNNCRWRLGFANAGLVPDDIFTKKYYLGGFMSMDHTQNYPDGNVVEEVLDDMKVRAVCLDDGSGRGVAAFAVIDAIGISNGDVRAIRAALADFAAENNIVSINIGATHSHSCIDTQGLWSCSYTERKKRIKNKKHREKFLSGYADKSFIDSLCLKTADAIRSAFYDMKDGTLFYNETDIGGKMHDKRPRERGLDVGGEISFLSNLSKFTFVPDDKEAVQTIILNMNVHPCIVGLETFCEDKTKFNYGECLSNGRQLSGDYVAYIDEAITNAGYNMMFLNGAVMGIYASGGDIDFKQGFAPPRYLRAVGYGREIADIVLSMKLEDAEKITPFLNVRCSEVISKTDNPVIIAIGKLGITHNIFLKGGDGYKAVTEVGYVEIGEKKAAMVPGEICPDLINGKYSMTEDYSISGNAFPLPSFSEAAGFDGGKNILVFGLMNDAAGYIVPDNDFALIRYHDMLCFGSRFASCLVRSFMDIIKTTGA